MLEPYPCGQSGEEWEELEGGRVPLKDDAGVALSVGTFPVYRLSCGLDRNVRLNSGFRSSRF